jgi:hypothetical protein
MSVVPSAISFVVWACLSIVTRPGWPRYVLSLALGKDASGEAQWLFIALMVLHLHMLSPLVAWALGHRRLRRECVPSPPLTDAYRDAPRLRSSWLLAGPAPWWAAGFWLASLLATLLTGMLYSPTYSYMRVFQCEGPSTIVFMGCFVIVNTLLLALPVLALLPNFVLWYLWFRWARRDASRAGILERAEGESATSAYLMRTLADQRPVHVVAVNVGSRRIRLSGAGAQEVWFALEPINDLEPMVPWRTAE